MVSLLFSWLEVMLAVAVFVSSSSSSPPPSSSLPSSPTSPPPPPLSMTTTIMTSHRTKLIFDHDGGLDDFVALLTLLSKPHLFELIGVTILAADCYGELAANTTLKILHTFGYAHVPVALSSLKGINDFPSKWRWDGLGADVLPFINDPRHTSGRIVPQPGEEFLADLLMGQEHPVTVVSTGPLSNIAYVLQKHGEAVASKVAHLWWMGGALRVPGNVEEPGHDGSAEWNAYWDPLSVRVVWDSSLLPQRRFTIVPLDATNHVPVTLELLYRFGAQVAYPYSTLAACILSHTISWVYVKPTSPVCFWDVLTTSCMLEPALCAPGRMELETYVVTEGASEGRIAVVEPSEQCSDSPLSSSTNTDTLPLHKRNVTAIMTVETEAFYHFLLDTLRMY